MSLLEKDNHAIGGYFGLELPPNLKEWHENALRYQSARAAFLALLLTGKPAKVWLPWYICDTMLEPLRMAGVPIAPYALDETLGIKTELTIGKDEWLLYVNYFGICGAQVDQVLSQYPRNQVIIDNSQSFFSDPSDCLATIYSPRKFFGVADGGYLYTSLKISPPEKEDVGSIARCNHLLKRLALGAEAGYSDFSEAEMSLVAQSPMNMSRLSRKMLASIDYQSVQSRRRENFDYLHQNLMAENQFNAVIPTGATPMIYPFIKKGHKIREHLLAHRIFVPRYWPELQARGLDIPEFESQLASELVPLPIDQRYGTSEMEHMLYIIKNSPVSVSQ